MALVACRECKAQISKSAKTCPQCGAKGAKGIWGRVLIFTVLLFLLLAYLATDTAIKYSKQVRENDATLKALAAQNGAASKPRAIQPHGWDYDDLPDKMTGKATRMATLKSTQSMALKFPYSGSNYGSITIRKKASESADVLFSFEKGQSLCRSFGDPCAVMVRFDDLPPVRYSGAGPSDGSTNYVFLSPASKFISEAKKAKEIKISLDIYNNGRQVLEFAAPSPLNW